MGVVDLKATKTVIGSNLVKGVQSVDVHVASLSGLGIKVRWRVSKHLQSPSMVCG